MTTTYPISAGFKARGTSEVSAIAVTPCVATIRDRVLRSIMTTPQTVDELSERLDISGYSLRPRVSELRALRQIEDSKVRRANASGHTAIVWQAVSTSQHLTGAPIVGAAAKGVGL